MKIKNISLTALFSLLFVAAVASFGVRAETSRSFSISPPSFEISASPGDILTNTIKITNLADDPISLTVKGENFVAYGQGGQVNLTEEDSTYSINRWLVFKSNSFTVPAHETYLFDFTLQIPQNAEPGSHYGAVVFANNPLVAQTGSGATVVQEVGALVLIRIPGDVNEDASIVSFAPETQAFQDPRIKLNTLVENTGGVHFKTTPFITIYDIFGNKVKTVEGTGKNILPGSQRLFDEQFDFDGFGYYKATVTMYYSSGEKILTADTSFIALNLQKSVPIAVSLIALVVIYLVFRKRINKAVKILVKG